MKVFGETAAAALAFEYVYNVVREDGSVAGLARLNVDRLEERANTKQPQRRQSPSL